MGTGTTILLTRPREGSDAFAAALRAAGVEAPIVISPLLRIERLGVVPDLSGFRGVIFTSKNGVETVPGAGLPVWCVGQATAEAAVARGWQPAGTQGDAESLFERICADKPEGPLLHIRGEHTRGDLAARLCAAGIETRETIVYRQVLQDLDEDAMRLLQGEKPLVCPLFSPRTAQQLADQGPFAAPLQLIAISSAVAEELRGLPRERLLVAKAPDAQAMLNAVKSVCDAA
ncbi:uroporphyrinogen-III synthase [Salinihabitans flavidus]|uniref:Uroporphyrinogen-III synthase n=2 Tax=Salinihabitans flavidus TaxID=569882 RepID=A0A1H8UPT2_9RHOB|nr:uroporphyrinogen-III synthase [Salinihabitans flavidus]